MAKINNQYEANKYFRELRNKSVKKAIAKKKGQPVVYKKPKPRTRVKKVSAKEKIRKRKYSVVRKKFFEDPTNEMCQIRMSEICIEIQQPATEVHHSKGRIGELLFDTEYFVPGCRECHRLAHLKDKEAKAKGVSKSRLVKVSK